MKKSFNDKNILREYIENILTEYDGGYDVDYTNMSDSPMGMSWGGPGLFKTFIEPFVDVLKTGKAASEKVSSKVKTLGKVIFETLKTTLIPALESNYKQIFDSEKEQIKKINQKYSDVYDRTNKALFQNDIIMAAFMTNPALFITAIMAKKSPEVALDVIEVFTGKRYTIKVLSEKYNAVLSKKINDSNTAKSMRNDANDITNNTFQSISKSVNHINGAKSINDLGTIIPQQDLQKLLTAAGANADPNFQKSLLDSIKSMSKDYYASSLMRNVDTLRQNGITNDFSLVGNYMNLIKKIKS